MTFDVYGRFRLDVQRETDSWVVYRLGSGKRVKVHNVVIPETLGPEIRFATDGVKTIRVQNREDGFFVDQIVLSPSNYRNVAPGLNKDDSTILPPTP